MNYVFHPEAEDELLQAIDYYENCEKGLGHDFAVEIYSAVQRAIAYPKGWPILEDEVRRCQTRRFPYGIVYAEEEGAIVIVGVMHLHRNPGYWKHRL